MPNLAGSVRLWPVARSSKAGNSQQFEKFSQQLLFSLPHAPLDDVLIGLGNGMPSCSPYVSAKSSVENSGDNACLKTDRIFGVLRALSDLISSCNRCISCCRLSDCTCKSQGLPLSRSTSAAGGLCGLPGRPVSRDGTNIVFLRRSAISVN